MNDEQMANVCPATRSDTTQYPVKLFSLIREEDEPRELLSSLFRFGFEAVKEQLQSFATSFLVISNDYTTLQYKQLHNNGEIPEIVT